MLAAQLPIGPLVGIFDVFRVFRKATRSSGVQLFERAPEVRTAADAVLGAADLADLEDRLDEMFMNLPVWGSELDSVQEPSGFDGDEARRVLGVTAVEILEKAQARALSGLENLPVPSTPGIPQDLSALVDCVYDAGIPLAAREIYLEVWHGMLAGLVVLRAVEIGRKLDPWLALALANTTARGFETATTRLTQLTQLLAEGDFEQVETRFATHFEETRQYENYLVSFYQTETETALA